MSDPMGPPAPPDPDDDTLVWRRVDRSDVNRLVAEWRAVRARDGARLAPLDSSPNARSSRTRLPPLFHAFYLGQFSALVGPPPAARRAARAALTVQGLASEVQRQHDVDDDRLAAHAATPKRRFESTICREGTPGHTDGAAAGAPPGRVVRRSFESNARHRVTPDFDAQADGNRWTRWTATDEHLSNHPTASTRVQLPTVRNQQVVGSSPTAGSRISTKSREPMRHPPLARGSSNTRPTAHVGGRPRGESNFTVRIPPSIGR